MLRGSKPGERRGGRERGTPNRRTDLRDRILAIGLEQPAASQRDFLLKLVGDPNLPGDIRMAIAPRCFPSKGTRPSRAGRPRALGGRRASIAQEALAADGSTIIVKGLPSKGAQGRAAVPAMADWSPDALETLFGVVRDASADPKVRRQAAQKIAEFLLPKTAKKPKIMPDEYGFLIRPSLSRAYRDMQLELRALLKDPSRKVPAFAEKIEKLQARSAAIIRWLELPCPTKYGDKEAAEDYVKLLEFSVLRDGGAALSEAQDTEEAHVRTRYDVFCAGPEAIARRRRQALEDAERWFQKNRFFGQFRAPPLSQKQRHDLRLLRWLYPEPKANLPQLNDDGLELYDGHPFADEFLAPDGNFYPMYASLKEAGAADDRKWLEQLRDIERQDLMLQEDGEAQQNPELLWKCRMRALEERHAVGFELTASEQQELRESRERDPEFAAVMALMDFGYLYHWSREFKRAKKAGLNTFAAFLQAEIACLNTRDETKFTTESEAHQFLRARSSKPVEVAAVQP